MPIPQPAQGFLNASRASVSSLNAINAGVMIRNAENYLWEAISWVKPSELIDLARDEAVARIRDVAEGLIDSSGFPRQPDVAAMQAQERAMASIDSVEAQMKLAGPSEKAIGLGEAWESPA
ncbi:hypothetical protein [Sphingomonas sanxanigenens]|uniref:hypothetical protein n=1 Tax=Sphingomonas sanxanigenens TaxID=397260 RepID=UPI001300EA10|nr:hypothetical protein [Sphingomonas sanxanigenens]